MVFRRMFRIDNILVCVVRRLLLASPVLAMMTGCVAPSYTSQTFAPTNAATNAANVSAANGMTACADLARDPTITNPSLVAECESYRRSRSAYNDRVNTWKAQTGGTIEKCDPVVLSAAWCGQTEQQKADAIAAQVAADHVVALRAKRDAGKKLTPKPHTSRPNPRSPAPCSQMPWRAGSR
jgi:hypothetical protein